MFPDSHFSFSSLKKHVLRVETYKIFCLVQYLYTLFSYFSTMNRIFVATILLLPLSSPAQNNWKQQVDTRIEVRLDDNNNMLYAYEEFDYTNNSPDTLKYLYIHLWPNAYRNDKTPYARQQDINGGTAFYYSKPKDRGYIDSLQFSVNGQPVEHYSAENVPDIARIDLPQQLLPGATVKVTTPFKVKLPEVFSRSGHTGQAYYVSQWFPKPAVYDRKGWHPISYLDQGEFYSEYGSYDVKITLPSNYVLLATGNCMDEKENQWMDALASKEISTGIDFGFPTSSPDLKTILYHEDNVHDFAWFADKRFALRKDTVASPANGQLVTTWAAFLPIDQQYGEKLTTYLADAIKHYGKWVGPYPYKTMKAVMGDMKSGAGMEYPTITLLDQSAKSLLRTATIHEAGHNWFYGILGSNEREHAWMDEGLNTFYEQKTIRDLDSLKAARKVSFDENLLYYEFASTNEDQAIDIPAQNFKKVNYGVDVYYKSNLMLMWLEQFMGEADFENGMKDYYNTWHHNHPYPEDFKLCMERNTDKVIDWFFTDILTTEDKIDFKVKNAKVRGGNTVITVKNRSGVKSPALIDVYDHGNLVNKIWTPPFSDYSRIVLSSSSWTALKIDDVVPDAKSANDLYRPNAIFHRFGVKVNPFLGLNTINKDKLFIAPAIGYNEYDGFMAGLLFHDLTLPENRFRFALAPLYGFGSKSFTGAGSIGYMWYPHKLFKEIMLQVDGKSFHYNETHLNLADPLYVRYMKVAPSLNVTFRERNPLSSAKRTLTLKEYNINEDRLFFYGDPNAAPVTYEQTKFYGLIRYKHENDRVYNPFSYSAEGQIGEDFAKVSLQGNFQVDYNVKNKALYVRGYLGKFFALNDNPTVASRYYLNSSYSGINDYLYDGSYQGRSALDHIWAQQLSTIQEGGFKIPVHNGVGRSDDWLAAINLKTDLPLPYLPIRLFFDAGLIPNYNQSATNISSKKLLYDGGIEVYLSKDICSVYFPIIMSGDFRDYLNNTFGHKNVFVRSISFTVHLENINWLKLPQRLLSSAAK